MIRLTASDGTPIGAYRAEPQGAARGGLVVLQEIFGVNAHVRSVADRYAALGYLVVAPALFDRVSPDLELGYDEAGMKAGFAAQRQTTPDTTLKDVDAAVQAVKSAGKVGVVGYCWGGTLAFASACALADVAATVGYYGGGIAAMLDRKPRVPVMLHFGEQDGHIWPSDVQKIKDTFPSMPVYTYPAAGHGFNRDVGSSYHKESADLALSRTLAFLAEHVG